MNSVADSGKRCGAASARLREAVTASAEARPHLIFLGIGTIDDSESDGPQVDDLDSRGPIGLRLDRDPASEGSLRRRLTALDLRPERREWCGCRTRRRLMLLEEADHRIVTV